MRYYIAAIFLIIVVDILKHGYCVNLIILLKGKIQIEVFVYEVASSTQDHALNAIFLEETGTIAIWSPLTNQRYRTIQYRPVRLLCIQINTSKLSFPHASPFSRGEAWRESMTNVTSRYPIKEFGYDKCGIRNNLTGYYRILSKSYVYASLL